MDDSLKLTLNNYGEYYYVSADGVYDKHKTYLKEGEAISQIEQTFYNSFKKAYLEEFNLDDEHLSVNDVRILNLAATTFGVEAEPLKVVGE